MVQNRAVAQGKGVRSSISYDSLLQGEAVLCSTCGHKNPAPNRFCGMCGAPLPQKPDKTPAAQSALSFTPLPLETPQANASTSVSYTHLTLPTILLV